ncbi:MAG: PIN domain-containing protein [Myxococcaceae bacterium]
MANAEDCYVDPSALRRLYVHDLRSRAFARWRSGIKGTLPTTLHGKAELVNSIMLAVFRGDLEPVNGDLALSDLDDDYAQGRLVVVDLLWRRAFDQALRLSRDHTPTLGTRTLDVLHVASAVTIGCRRFVTYDERQAKLARAIGLKVLMP